MGLIKLSKKKVSIDFSEKAYQLLIEYTQKLGVSNSALINFLIENFLSMDDEEKRQWTKFCSEILNKEKDVSVSISNDFEMKKRSQKVERYSNLLYLLATRDRTNVLENMERIDIEDGYVIFPNDWIVIDYRKPEECKYVGVVSIRNGEKYNVPIFLFFSDVKINALTEGDEDDIRMWCRKKYPDFAKIESQQVTPAYNAQGKMLNFDFWDKAPTIGIFPIFEYGKDTNYPYGAMIIRETE